MLCWGISRKYMLGASVYQGGICWGISKSYMLGPYIKEVYAGVYQGGICCGISMRYMLRFIKEVYA